MIAKILTLLGRSSPPQQPRALPAVAPSYNALLARIGEYNPKVQGRAWFEVVNKMRNNSRIMALEYILTLPITSTHWEVYPPRSPSRDAAEAAEYLNNDLFNSDTSLYEILRLGILARFYGIRALEPVWTIADRVNLADVIDIHPSTIAKIEFDNGGAPQAIVQSVPARGEARIPWDDLIVFTWRREGGDPLGYPDLRPLYGDWYRLEFLYSILSVAAERAGIGAWQATLPRNLYDNDQLRREILSILKSIRSYEGGALIVPEGVTIEVLKAIEQQGIDALLRLAQHYETNLATAILANITQLGMRDVGTQALAQVLFDMFLLQLNHTARWLADAINTQLVRKWVAYNYPQLAPDQYPRLQFTDLRLLLKREAVVDAITQTIQAGVIPPDANLQDYIRDILSLPPPSQPQPNTTPVNFAKIDTLGAERVELARDPLASESQFAAALQYYLRSVESLNAPKIQQMLESARSNPEALQDIVNLELDGIDQYRSIIEDYLVRFAIEARAALARDYNPNIDPPKLPTQLRAYIRAKAATLARDHYERLRASVIYAALAETLKSTPVLSAAEILRNTASQRVNTDLRNAEREAQALLERINNQLREADAE